MRSADRLLGACGTHRLVGLPVHAPDAVRAGHDGEGRADDELRARHPDADRPGIAALGVRGAARHVAHRGEEDRPNVSRARQERDKAFGTSRRHPGSATRTSCSAWTSATGTSARPPASTSCSRRASTSPTSRARSGAARRGGAAPDRGGTAQGGGASSVKPCAPPSQGCPDVQGGPGVPPTMPSTGSRCCCLWKCGHRDLRAGAEVVVHPRP